MNDIEIYESLLEDFLIFLCYHFYPIWLFENELSVSESHFLIVFDVGKYILIHLYP